MHNCTVDPFVMHYFVLTSIQRPVPDSAIRKDKCLHSPLSLLFGYALEKGEPALESNHGFINRELTRGVVGLLRVVDQWIMSVTLNRGS